MSKCGCGSNGRGMLVSGIDAVFFVPNGSAFSTSCERDGARWKGVVVVEATICKVRLFWSVDSKQEAEGLLTDFVRAYAEGSTEWVFGAAITRTRLLLSTPKEE